MGPERLAVLEWLRDGGRACTAGEAWEAIGKPFGLTHRQYSGDLQALVASGFVVANKDEWPWTYTVAPTSGKVSERYDKVRVFFDEKWVDGYRKPGPPVAGHVTVVVCEATTVDKHGRLTEGGSGWRQVPVECVRKVA